MAVYTCNRNDKKKTNMATTGEMDQTMRKMVFTKYRTTGGYTRNTTIG